MAEKILIVDDDPDILEAMRMVLEAQSFEVHSAVNGTDGLKKVKAVNPDLIILDVMMDQLTEGFQVTYTLKNVEPGSEYAPYAKIPILMLSSFPKKMVEEGSEKFQHLLGEHWPVTHFLEKPVEPEELLSTVENLIAQPKQT